MSQGCQSCHRQVSGGEVCPFCFAPLVLLHSQYTVDTEVSECSETPIGPIHARKLPDLQSIKFRPAPALYRSITQAKTGIASAMVAVLFVGFGLLWWVNAQRAGAQEATQEAQVALENQKYLASCNLWERAFKDYRSIFDQEGQVKSLLGMSDCYQGMNKLTESIAVLQRAEKIQASEDIAERILQCNILLGQAHLQQAETYFQPDLYGKAFLEAKTALAFFEEGKASDAKLASVNRIAARCSVKLKDFEGAEAYLDQAFQLEGKSKNNLVLASQLEKAYAQSRQRLAGSGSESYIPTGKIDPSVIVAANRNTDSSLGKRRGSHGGYALQVYTPRRERGNERWRHVGTPSSVYKPLSLEASSYPTHQKAPPEEESTESEDRSSHGVRNRQASIPVRFPVPIGGFRSKPRPSRIQVSPNYPTAGRRN